MYRELVIASGSTESTGYNVRRFKSAYIKASTALTGTVTPYGSLDGGVTYAPIQSESTNITFAAGTVSPLTLLECTHLKLVSSGTEAATRTFQMREGAR